VSKSDVVSFFEFWVARGAVLNCGPVGRDQNDSLSSIRQRLAHIVTGLILQLWGSDGWCSDAQAAHTAQLETSSLRVVFADNAAYAPTYLAGYNGVAELRLGGWDEPNLFVPLYAGLNLEHIFSGSADTFDWNIFEPRRAPMELRQTSKRRVELRQERTEHWPMRSRLVYEVKGDAIDMTYHIDIKLHLPFPIYPTAHAMRSA
jgi:hypothetical protein